MVFRKALKKAYTGAKKAVKKRYGLNKKSKTLKYGQMAKDMMMLKQMVNAEKQIFNFKPSEFSVGQVNYNTTGAYLMDITPLIPQGDSRKGLSVKLSSALYQFQITQQVNGTIANRVCIEFWLNKGQPLSATDLLPQVYNNATFSNVIDFNSPRNADRYSDYKLLRKVVKYLPADPNPGDAPTITFDVPFSFNRGQGHHIRLVSSISGTPQNDITNGQIFMTMRLEHGNNSTLASPLTSIPVVTAQSGASVRFAYRTWYYDN